MVMLRHQTAFDPCHGQAVTVTDGVRRLTAPNPSPLTFHGTNTYLVGEDNLVVIDPGPDDDAHLEAILRAADGKSIATILLTHTHRDHSGLVQKLHAATGAKTACSVRLSRRQQDHAPRAERSEAAGEDRLDESFVPNRKLKEGDKITSGRFELSVLETPGHTANHLVFALEGTPYLFSGDHVMAWSTSVVAPPEGSMHDYLLSLDKMLARREEIYLPGHGAPVEEPHSYVAALMQHRLEREAQIVKALRGGFVTIPTIVGEIYQGLAPGLYASAGLSVFAHLEDLIDRGLVRSSEAVANRNAHFSLVGERIPRK